MTSGGSAVLPRLPQHVQAVDLALQLQVRNDHVDPLIAQHLDGVLARVDRQGLNGQLAESLHHAVGMIALVVHDQDDRSAPPNAIRRVGDSFLFCPMTIQDSYPRIVFPITLPTEATAPHDTVGTAAAIIRPGWSLFYTRNLRPSRGDRIIPRANPKSSNKRRGAPHCRGRPPCLPYSRATTGSGRGPQRGILRWESLRKRDLLAFRVPVAPAGGIPGASVG